MPDRPTPSDVDGSDLEVSDLKGSDLRAPDAAASEPVASGEVNDGAARPVTPDAAPSPSSAPVDHPTLDGVTAPLAEEPGSADSSASAAQQPDLPVVPPASEVGPTEVIPRAGAADESFAPAGSAAETDVIAREALTSPSPSPRSAAPQPTSQPTEPTAGAAGDEPPTELIPVVPPPPRARRRRALLLTGAVVVGLLVLLYAVDLVTSSGTVPRGVTVAGQEIGGLSHADAEQRVRTAVEPRTTRPVAVAVGDVTSEIDPKAAGLTVDWPGTIDRAGTQPWNPITRVRSFFTTREVGVATVVDEEALDSALQQLAPVVDKQPVEGTVRFDGVTPVPVPPVDGQSLDLAVAKQTLERDWISGERVALPTTVLHPTTTQDDVTKAVADVATPAVSGPVTVIGEKVTGTISPEVIASALSFRADPDQGLVPELNKETVEKALDPQLASSEQPGRDAAISFVGGRPVVRSSQDGRGIDYDASLKDLLTVLTKTGDDRRVTVVYGAQPAKLTTEQLNGYGIKEVMGEFTTGGFAPDSGRNIKRAASVINGTIIGPGETFSLNKLTEPRDAAHGYIEAGVIQDGHASRDVGGGVSQVATTTYNAAYFAGMTDVVHKPHSFYISRYPPGREATVVSGPLDLKWRNDTPGGVLVQTVWTPSTLTVRIWGTKRYDVTSSQGPRTNPTQPTKIEIPAGEPCTPSQGAPGFTISDTRTLRDIRTGAVRTEKRTTKYNPAPIVTCGAQ